MLWNDRLPICCFFWQIRVMRISLELPPSPPSSPPLSLSDGVFPLESLPSVFWSIWRTLTALEDFYKIDSLDLKLLRPAVGQCQSLLLQTHYKHHLYTVNIKPHVRSPQRVLPNKVCLRKMPTCSLIPQMSAMSNLSEVYAISHVSVFKSPENPVDAKIKMQHSQTKRCLALGDVRLSQA